jgi:hypothetical protein
LGQEKYIYEFEKLAITDTIFTKDIVDTLKIDIEYNYDDYFFADRYFKGEIDGTIHCLIKKKNDYWISYAIPYEYGPGQSTSLIGPSENKKYFLASSYYNHLSHGGGHGNENTIEKLIVIDIENNSAAQIESYIYDMFWNDDESSGKNYIISKFIFENNYLIILNTCINSEGIEDCKNLGGLYEFKNDRLKKIKKYNPTKMGFTTITYIGDIAIGMTLEELRLVYLNAIFTEKENKYGSCAESKNGYEIWNNNKLLGFALTKSINEKIEYTETDINYSNEKIANEKITSFIVLPSNYNDVKINENITAYEVLKNYPKANIRIDSLTEWEHIFIKELNMEFVFKTDENSRIGIYKNEQFVKLKNKKAKPDFIEIN